MAEGLRCAKDTVRGRGTLGAVSPEAFARAVLLALRPQFFALPAGAALAGAAAAGQPALAPRVLVATAAAAAGWGVGQLLNDLVDRPADAIDAPHRPAVRGLLPDGPTVLVAGTLGALVATCTVLVHPMGALLAASAVTLLLAYDAAKRLPLAGNLAHGALIANAALIGAAAARPDASLADVVRQSWLIALVSGGWAAVYLEANYEKDRVGDARAGQRTLPQLVGLRLSAALRVAVGLALALTADRFQPFAHGAARAAWWACLGLIGFSALRVFLRPDEHTALANYRYAVHAGTIGMLALGSAALGVAGTTAAILAALVLTERAFAQSKNP